MYGRIGRIHFVGIGGTGMNGIAEVLLELGYKVSGSDLADTPVTARLRARGGLVDIGHDAAHVKGASVVVVSTAVRPDNPEVARARELGIPVIPRAEMLAELMRVKYGVAVAGAHGKTTTTSMVAHVLTAGGVDPTVVVGGRVLALDSNARVGKGPYLVAEADESDGSFLKLSPSIAVVTNIDAEHLDHYRGGLPEIRNAFIEFANKVPFYGVAIVCLDDPEVQKVLPSITRRVKTYGESVQADFVARDLQLHREDGHVGLSYEFVERRQSLGRIRMEVSGRHNVLNSLAAAAVGRELELDFTRIQEGLAAFRGVARRLERKGEAGGVRVIDDYGHHPTEAAAVLATLREAYDGRLLVAFQPHRYTRTRDFYEQFGRCFLQSDRLFLLPVYAAGEPPIPGVDSELIARSARGAGHKSVEVVSGPAELVDRIVAEARPGDVVLTLGAGDITKLGETLVARLGGGIGGAA
jgi:UDP-N-acetylmuramate--alanine ligase